MAKVKTFEDFVSEMDRAEEIQQDVIATGEPEEKTKEEAEAEAEIAQAGDELAEANDVTPIQAKGDGTNPIIPVSEMLEKCYERAIEEAKEWAEDAHDDHTVETYMAENAALVAKMGVTALSRLKEEMSTEAFEACLNKMAESYTKKINESKEVKAAEDAEDIE